MNGVLRIPAVTAEGVVVHRQVDSRRKGLDKLRRQADRRTARAAQLIVTEDARIILEQAERAASGGRDIPRPVDEQKDAVVLERDRVGHGHLMLARQLRVTDGFFHRARYLIGHRIGLAELGIDALIRCRVRGLHAGMSDVRAEPGNDTGDERRMRSYIATWSATMRARLNRRTARCRHRSRLKSSTGPPGRMSAAISSMFRATKPVTPV